MYRESNRYIPIISRAPQAERGDVSSINNIEIWSPAAQKMVALSQMVSNFDVNWENAIIQRRDKMATITVHADQMSGMASVLFARVAPKIQAMFDAKKLTGDYSLEWGGEHESSADGQAGLMGKLPVFIMLMILIVIFLFNALRQTLIIWLCVPLAIIGVSAGLLLTGQPFGFMALLGILSLMGMLIKNAIVLIDQIDLEIREGKDMHLAVLDSSVSRMRPVMMAAATTVLGMAPLLLDAFYISMAVTIMFGLTFAAVLTLIVVPVLYSIFFRIPRVKG